MDVMLKIVATNDAANYRKGDLIAFQRELNDGWQDPWGGVFDDRDQHEFYEVAAGHQDEVNLLGANDVDRVVPCRLVAEYGPR